MIPTMSVEKVSEEYRDYIITSGFICSFINYLEYEKAKNPRQRIEKDIEISEDIMGKLKIYPTGIKTKFNNCISIYVEARWKKSKSIAIKIDTAVLDTNGKRLLSKSSENFRKIPSILSIGDPQVLHVDYCRKNQAKFLNGGCLNILVNISIHVGMMIHPEMLDRFRKEYEQLESNVIDSLRDPLFGDATLVVGGKRFSVERDVLIRGNPKFANVFKETSHDSCEYTLNEDPEIILHIIIDCYLNGGQ